MASINKIILVSFWAPQAVYQVLTWIYWWQDKEYRLDRFRVLLLSRDSLKKLWIYIVVLKLIAILLLVGTNYQALIIIILLIVNILFVVRLKKEGLRRPVFTQRARRIFSVSMIFLIVASLSVLLYSNYELHFVLLGEVSLLISPYIGIMLTTPIVERTRKKEVRKAYEKLERVNPLVIGVAGSYGKTTTKDFIAEVLKKKYVTEKTVRNENTDFGIARKIINDFSYNTEVFVVEMGAYQRGDIKRLCQMVKPDIGIITGVEPQHLELFGNMENIMRAKYEIIESLPKGGLAVFNLSNPYNFELFKKVKKHPSKLRVKSYGVVGVTPSNVKIDFGAKLINLDEKGVKFEISQGSEVRKLYAPVAGIHFIENFAAAALIARHLKVGWASIQDSFRKMKTPKGIMTLMSFPYNSLVVNDTYNATPRSFESALKYLEYFKNRKKLVITPGIIELGKYSERVHKKIGSIVAKSIDKIILTNIQFAPFLKKGMGRNQHKLEIIEDPSALIKRTEKFIEGGTIILLEGRLPYAFMNYIEKRKK